MEQYGNVYATVSDSYDRKNHDHLSAFTGTYSSTLAVSRYGVNLGASGTDDLLGAVLVDVKASLNRMKRVRICNSKRGWQAAELCSLVKVTVCCSLITDFSLVLLRLTTVAV